jgi:hypothetical protein
MAMVLAEEVGLLRPVDRVVTDNNTLPKPDACGILYPLCISNMDFQAAYYSHHF